MERELEKKVEELRAKGIEVYSFSRLECFNNCLYEAYRTYILDKRDSQIPNIYSVCGSRIHDVLEKIMNNQANTSDLLPAMERELKDMNMLGIEFPKGKNGTNSLRDGWIADMTSFCNSYTKPKGNFETETFFLYESPNNHYVQGYIDLTKFNNDGTISIYDYKTSSLYCGDDIQKHGRQLVLYAMGKEQQGFKVKEIAWIMLKYCEVSYQGKKTSRSKEEIKITKIIERKNIIQELKPVIENKLSKKGFDDIEIELKIIAAQETNLIPEEVKKDFIIKPYVMKYELTDDIRQDCKSYIDSTIEKWEALNSDKASDYPPLPFTKTNKNGDEKEDLFYHRYLCGYAKQCPHLQKYLDTRERKKEDEDLF